MENTPLKGETFSSAKTNRGSIFLIKEAEEGEITGYNLLLVELHLASVTFLATSHLTFSTF